jgi:hypothetical protein
MLRIGIYLVLEIWLLEFDSGKSGRSADWFARLPWGRRVTLRGITSNSLSRRREGEAAGPAVKPSEYKQMASGDEVSF